MSQDPVAWRSELFSCYYCCYCFCCSFLSQCIVLIQTLNKVTCHPSHSLTTFAFKSSEVRRLFLDLDPYGGTDPSGIFPLFINRTADVMPPRLSVVFQRLVRLGSFPPCWRQVNVTPIPKGPPPSSVANYRPISITSVLSKVFERLVSVCLGRFMGRSGVLPTTWFAYRQGLGTCDALLLVNVVSGVPRRAVFWGRYCTSCALRSFFPFWKRS